MVTINLSEVANREEIAVIILEKMEMNGIKKSEIILGTQLSKTAVNRVLCVGNLKKDYRFETLLKVLSFMKIQLFIGRNKEQNTKVLSLF